MFDTVCFRLLQEEATGADFLSETPCYLTDIGEHYYNGVPCISGSLRGLKVWVSQSAVRVKDGSLCKFYLGDNFKTLGRRDTQCAIEMLSDMLHLPMDRADVTRIDVAENMIMEHPVSVYFNHLGQLAHATRLQEPSGLYYRFADECLCFYDKLREQKKHRNPIPQLFQDRNVLRYEQRYLNRIAARLKEARITGGSLYNEQFYIKLKTNWRDRYKAITKINNFTLNFEAMTNRKQFNQMGTIALAEKVGGQLELLKQIEEAQKCKILTRKQAFDFKKAINDAFLLKGGLTAPNDAIQELDKKIVEAVRYFR
jgi:hypothetical protein